MAFRFPARSGFRSRRSALCVAVLLLATGMVDASEATAQGRGPAAPLSAFSRAKAERLLKDHLPCLGCHALDGQGGTIGPDLSTVRQRRSPEYIAAMVADPQRVSPGAMMPRVTMSAATRALVIGYLSALPGAAAGPPPLPATPAPPSAAPDGAALYARWCAACHGATGRGNGPNAAHLPTRPAVHASREAMSQRPDDSLFDTIASGGTVMNRSPRMPPYGQTLSPSEIRALVRHIRTLCNCEGPAWSRR